MRRALASLLLPVLSIPLLLPAFFDAEASNVPACCRRAGKHHCTTPEAKQDRAGAGLRAIAPKCPLYSRVGVLPSGPTATLLSRSFSSHPPILPTIACVASSDFVRNAAGDRSSQKRGPPSLSF